MVERSPTIVEQSLPAPNLTHLRSLTHHFGVFEHAEYDRPRPDHGFCVDDNAPALIVACREGTRPGAIELAQTTLRFVLDARDPVEGLRNRRQLDGRWLDEPRSDDAEGRAIWALGVAARRAPTAWLRRTAMDAFADSPAIDSPHLRPHATAMAGAAEVIAMAPRHPDARRLLQRGADRLAAASGPGPWLEPRLTYDDARLPDGLLAAGVALHDRDLVNRALDLLTWLVDEQQHEDRFSFTPTGGREPGGPKPAFDQQPLEAAAMADACLRAWFVTGDQVWQHRVGRVSQWLLGANDTGVALYDAMTGGTYDGLTSDGANQNRGAESTIAGLSVLQAVRAAGLPIGDR